MIRLLFTLPAMVATLTVAMADLGPRPKGAVGKSIPVRNVLKFANEFPNHTFWAVTVGQDGTNVVTLKADSSKPLPLTMVKTISAVVYAVPNDVAGHVFGATHHWPKTDDAAWL